MNTAAAILAALEHQGRELTTLRKGLDKLRAETRAEQVASVAGAHAVKRSVAAKLLGIGVTKLDTLIKAGKVRTAADVTLVPMSEIKRYTAPRVKRERNRVSGHRIRRSVDGQSDEAIADMKRKLRAAR